MYNYHPVPGQGRANQLYMRMSHNDATKCSKYWMALSGVVIITLLFYLPYVHSGPRKPIVFVWPSNQTRNASVLLSTSRSTTLLWPTGVCSNDPTSQRSLDEKPNTKIYLLVIVCSALQNFEERQVIRDSWAKDQEELSNVKVIFLVGQSQNDSLQSNLTNESQNYGDILQESFLDSYANLTLKSVMLLKWFTRECDKVPYVLKTDDDMYINLKQLFQLTVANKKPNLLMGSLICGAVPIRDPYNKWYCPEYMFDRKIYPNYLSGTAYLMSRHAASSLFEAAKEVPLFHLEDIYVTGILSEKVGIRPEDHIGFSFVKRKLGVCLYSQTISSHHLTKDEILEIYTKLTSAGDTQVCPALKAKQLRSYGPGKCKWKK